MAAGVHIRALVLTAVMALALAGCGGSSNDGWDTDPGPLHIPDVAGGVTITDAPPRWNKPWWASFGAFVPCATEEVTVRSITVDWAIPPARDEIWLRFAHRSPEVTPVYSAFGHPGAFNLPYTRREEEFRPGDYHRDGKDVPLTIPCAKNGYATGNGRFAEIVVSGLVVGKGGFLSKAIKIRYTDEDGDKHELRLAKWAFGVCGTKLPHSSICPAGGAKI